MATFIYLDNSNLWIEGKRVSAVRKDMAYDIQEAISSKIFDPEFRLDFGKLLNFINHQPITKANFYGSRPPQNDSLWGSAKSVGFDLHIFDRNISNKEKKVDTQISTDLVRTACKEAKEGDLFILMAGDSDHVPAVQALKEEGMKVYVAFWNHASRELKEAADQFIALDEHIDKITR